MEMGNRIPGIFQDFFIFQGLNFFPILYKTTHQNAKAHSISLILVIKTGTTAQIE